jgi:hypothetical protein
MSMWKWQEVQKMSWRCLTVALVAITTSVAAPKPKLPPNKPAEEAAAIKQSAIWPEKIGPLERQTVRAAGIPSDAALWEEHGFDTAEQAVYAGGGRKITATAYRMKDPTGAVSAYQLLLPADAKPAKLADYSALTKDGALVLYGNYVLHFENGRPTGPELKLLTLTLPKLDQSSLPALLAYLPDANLVRNSERYVAGPEALRRIEPKIPPSTAAFHLGAEAQTGRYRTSAGEAELLVFSYPTPQIARERESEFRKIQGALVKRAGPLVAVTIAPANADDAERILAGVKYQPSVTWNETVPKTTQQTAMDLSNLFLGIVLLTAVLAITSVLLGILFGGFRQLRARFGIRSANDEFTTLNIENK